ncbi:MAG: phosphoglucosamine mutase [Syntrophales bacterium]|nr:phosphoglucosamine mutase [Syntrophales bacterium]
MGRLFGTDGIRGRANEYPLTAEMAMKIGQAVAYLFKGPGHIPLIIVGRDTRISGDMIENALIAGLCSRGANAVAVGVLPTPGIAFLTGNMKAEAGIVISASHNPFKDNGIKIFGSEGWKLTEEKEQAIEDLLSDTVSFINPMPQECGRASRLRDAAGRYGAFLRQTFSEMISVAGVGIVLDCANGATSKVAPALFRQLGARVTALFCKPNGININVNCGSQHPGELAGVVVKKRAAVGFAFDGDGDRMIAVDEKGTVLTGDQMLAICAASLKKEGKLANNLVIRTVMSNIGMSVSFRKMGIDSVMTDVGDRAVLQEMRDRGAVIGGEDSGHLIFLNHHTTGDGIITALQLLEVMGKERKPLSELAKIMTVFPQTLINVEVKRREDPTSVPEIARIVKDVEDRLGKDGRVLVRYSGTQNLCRVMVEGPTAGLTRQCCRRIAEVVKETLN